jgi:hypothetical protein
MLFIQASFNYPLQLIRKYLSFFLKSTNFYRHPEILYLRSRCSYCSFFLFCCCCNPCSWHSTKPVKNDILRCSKINFLSSYFGFVAIIIHSRRCSLHVLSTETSDIAQCCPQTVQYFPYCAINIKPFLIHSIYCTIFQYDPQTVNIIVQCFI